MLREGGETLTAGLRDDLGDMRQKRRLVASLLRPRPKRARREKGRIRFNEQAARGDFVDDLKEMLTTPLVTDPPRHANKEAPLQICVEFTSLPGETVHHPLNGAGPVENRAETRVRLPFMEKHRHFAGLSESNLCLERRLLDVAG